MVNVENILDRNLKILKDIKNELKIEESLYNLIFNYDRFILNEDLKQKRIRLIGVLNQQSEKEEFFRALVPLYDPNEENVSIEENEPMLVTFPEKFDKKENRKQIYVLKKSNYEVLQKEEKNTILKKLELFRWVFKQIKNLRLLFEEEDSVIFLVNSLKIKNDLYLKEEEFKNIIKRKL